MALTRSLSFASSAPSSFDGEDVAFQDSAVDEYFDFSRFGGQDEDVTDTSEGQDGDLVDTLRVAVSSVLEDMALTEIDLVYPESGPANIGQENVEGEEEVRCILSTLHVLVILTVVWAV
ncbi:hypothetical protein C8R42DRAFT_323118 [Lentinula raphanica]|nr:hypothetical protein C8R42DRAFT_323118 [Lentinula raphanica]